MNEFSSVKVGAPGATDAERAAWLADKIGALGDYAKEAAAMLRRWPAGVTPSDGRSATGCAIHRGAMLAREAMRMADTTVRPEREQLLFDALDRQLDTVDAAVFSGELLWADDRRNLLKQYAERWLRAIHEREQTADGVGIPLTDQPKGGA